MVDAVALRLVSAAGLGAVLALPTASAQTVPDMPGVAYTVGVSALHDDNLFRIPDGADPRAFGFSTDDRGDTAFTPYFNVDDTILYSLQRITLSAGVSRQMLRINPSFDQTYFVYRGDWLWRAGDEFSGDLSDSQQQSQTSQADVRSSEANKQTYRAWHASADWRPRPDRRLGLSFDNSTGSNSASILLPNDFHTTIGRVELGIQSDLGHEIVVGLSQTRNEYPNRVISPVAPIDNTYRQRQIDIGTHFTVSDLTGMDVRFGYARRYYSDVPDRDFSGPVGSLGLTWQPTGLISVRLNVGRDLNEVIDAFRIYSVTTNSQASLTYELSAAIQLTAGADASRVDYKGVPQNLLTFLYGPGPSRVDKYLDVKLGVAWLPRDRVTVRLDLVASRRNSTLQEYQFEDLSTQLGLQYRIGP